MNRALRNCQTGSHHGQITIDPDAAVEGEKYILAQRPLVPTVCVHPCSTA